MRPIDNHPNTKSFGLTLGGGAVKGLAHIGLLKLIDKHGLTPAHISGTSMGAIIGALYAHGISGQEIETRIREHIIGPKDKFKHVFRRRKKLIKWLKVFGLEKSRGGLITADGLFTYLFDELIGLDFEDLDIKFSVSTTQFYSGKELIIDSGDLLPAVQASMAVPGVFAPVTVGSNVLVDGGLVNNLPCSHIQNCELKIASDVISLPSKDTLKTLDVVNGAINIMIVNTTEQIMKAYPVDLINKVDLQDIEAFDFHRIDDVLKIGDQAAADIEKSLLELF